jgi:hypothetical protein
MDLKIACLPERLPTWPRIREHLTGHGVAVEMRMIDGDLAFPDEEPPASWRELRVGTAAGMITLRREPDGVRLVIWGNAEPALVQSRDAIARTLVTLTQGQLETGETP